MNRKLGQSNDQNQSFSPLLRLQDTNTQQQRSSSHHNSLKLYQSNSQSQKQIHPQDMKSTIEIQDFSEAVEHQIKSLANIESKEQEQQPQSENQQSIKKLPAYKLIYPRSISQQRSSQQSPIKKNRLFGIFKGKHERLQTNEQSQLCQENSEFQHESMRSSLNNIYFKNNNNNNNTNMKDISKSQIFPVQSQKSIITSNNQLESHQHQSNQTSKQNSRVQSPSYFIKPQSKGSNNYFQFEQNNQSQINKLNSQIMTTSQIMQQSNQQHPPQIYVQKQQSESPQKQKCNIYLSPKKPIKFFNQAPIQDYSQISRIYQNDKKDVSNLQLSNGYMNSIVSTNSKLTSLKKLMIVKDI